jgi:transcriptional regulator with GAF, ATPase, and Fis domain
MADQNREPPHGLDDHALLRAIHEGTASETGEKVFGALVEHLCLALRASSAWVTQVLPAGQLRVLACWRGGQRVPSWEYAAAGTPCGQVIDRGLPVHIAEGVRAQYPDDRSLRDRGAVGYVGVPLLDLDRRVLGHLAVLDTNPLPQELRAQALVRIFAARAATELQRMRAESQVQQEETKLGRLMDGAVEAVIELDERLFVTRMNRAAEEMFRSPSKSAAGRDLGWLLSKESHERVVELAATLGADPPDQPGPAVAGPLRAVRADRAEIPAEGLLSQFSKQGKTYFTLMLRDLKPRLEADRKIHSLAAETEYLRQEVKDRHNFDEIVGRSQPLRHVLADVNRVAPTGTSVLIRGEIGSGKGLIARAIHAASPRSEHPFVRVSCAATPAALLERELFGIEEGSMELFGDVQDVVAAAHVDGRLALADGGTIFLDEVGALPPELQEKLVRVLQDGEFSPLGGARSRRVDVRVLSATSGDLEQAVESGRFRRDLHEVLTGFSVMLPPLRERRGDIPLLAQRFAERFARRTGRLLEPLSPEAVQRLRAYAWPGNVRELENVVERAVMTSPGSRLELDLALPEGGSAQPGAAALGAPDQVLGAKEMQELERANLIRALEKCVWKVSGEGGAAALLGLKPSTLNSRMKALKIKRPRK